MDVAHPANLASESGASSHCVGSASSHSGQHSPVGGTHAVAYLWAFVFQTLYLILDMLNAGDDPAFEPQTFPRSYGLVALSIFAAGFGLVALGHFVRDRRLARRTHPVGATA